MKVTALIPDSLLSEVRKLSKGKNITDSITIALREWIAIQKIQKVSKKIKKKPLKFSAGFSAEAVREINRKR